MPVIGGVVQPVGPGTVNVRKISSASITSVTGANGDVILVDASSAAVTVTVSNVANSQTTIKKVDTSSNVVTVTAYPSGLIDGDSNATLVTQNASATFVGDGTNVLIEAVDNPNSIYYYTASAGTDPSTLALRDTAGRSKFVDPAAAQDAATKNYVDNAFGGAGLFSAGFQSWNPGAQQGSTNLVPTVVGAGWMRMNGAVYVYCQVQTTVAGTAGGLVAVTNLPFQFYAGQQPVSGSFWILAAGNHYVGQCFPYNLPPQVMIGIAGGGPNAAGMGAATPSTALPVNSYIGFWSIYRPA